MSAVFKNPQHTAYDYETQRWVFGEQGRALRLRQLKDELALLRGSRAEAYLYSTVATFRPYSVAEAQRICAAQIAELEAAS